MSVIDIIIEGSLEVKLRQYGQIKSIDGKSQRREEKRREEKKSRREKIREEKESEERRCRCAKGRKVAKHCVFPMICGSGGSKSRLAKAAGAETSDQMRDEKLHAVVARSTLRGQNVQSTPGSEHFWKLRCWKSARRCDAKHISKSNCWKHHMLGPLLKVQMWFGVAGARDSFCTLPKVSKTWSFRAVPKTMAGVGLLQRICKDAFRVAGAIQETCSSEMLGDQGGDFLGGVAFWSIRSSGLLR